MDIRIDNKHLRVLSVFPPMIQGQSEVIHYLILRYSLKS